MAGERVFGRSFFEERKERERVRERREREGGRWLADLRERGSILEKPHMRFAIVYHTHTLTLLHLSSNPNEPNP